MRKEIVNLFHNAIQTADPYQATLTHLRNIKWNDRFKEFERIYVVGGGKASFPMARAVMEHFGDQIKEGLILLPNGSRISPLPKIKIQKAGHPIPDGAGINGTKAILHLLRQAGEKDLVICLLSGGGSALLVQPQEEIPLKDLIQMTDLLLKCGANIREINILRKHLSRVKGGQLVKTASPAAVLSLILSDVVGDPLDVIASGPTVPDSSTFQDCLKILEKYSLMDRTPQSTQRVIERGVSGQLEETPKRGEPLFERTQNLLIGNNLLALEGAKKKAVEYGYHPLILSSEIEGETREEAKKHVAFARKILDTGNPLQPPACLLSGGETTVKVVGKGKGGRNQEFALAAALEMEELPMVLLSGGTDGRDGNTDAAGAISDGETVRRAKGMGLDPAGSLANNDSYTFFKALDDLVITGPTNTNVMDFHLILITEES